MLPSEISTKDLAICCIISLGCVFGSLIKAGFWIKSKAVILLARISFSWSLRSSSGWPDAPKIGEISTSFKKKNKPMPNFTSSLEGGVGDPRV